MPTVPFVSVCTPTYNRRPFIPTLIKMFRRFDWPKDSLEWIIVDDGTDKVGDLFPKDDPQIKYFSIDKKMTLGAKRNYMHEKASGEFIVYMDDDDYYPPTRIRHAIESLQKNPQYPIAGSSIIHVYYHHIDRLMEFGPYAPYHATAGTFVFRKELLLQTKYQDQACLAEEKYFLKNYTIPMFQLDPLHTILVFAHRHNTFDKKKLLKTAPNAFTHETTKTIQDFIPLPEEEDIRRFFAEELDDTLSKYGAGEPAKKPDVVQQTNEMDKQRLKTTKTPLPPTPLTPPLPPLPQVGHPPTIQNALQIIQKNENTILLMQEKSRHYEQYIQQQNHYIESLTKLLQEANINIPFREPMIRKSLPDNLYTRFP